MLGGTPNERKHDYLKYHRVIFYYFKVKYNLSQADLDMLLFLYSEKYFGSDKFIEFAQVISWDKKRFDRLKKDGWIENFRNRTEFGGKALYSLTFKAIRMITSLYKKMNGEEIPMDSTSSPLFHKNVPFTHKVYRNMIKKMNEFRREKKLKGSSKDPFAD